MSTRYVTEAHEDLMHAVVRAEPMTKEPMPEKPKDEEFKKNCQTFNIPDMEGFVNTNSRVVDNDTGFILEGYYKASRAEHILDLEDNVAHFIAAEPLTATMRLENSGVAFYFNIRREFSIFPF